MTANLLDRITALAGTKVLIIGDVMLDEYLSGDADRLSPEAPVPVVKVAAESVLLGGAGNVARNVKALGAEPVLLGVKGSDSAGDRLSAVLGQSAIEHCLLTLPDRPTTVKTRVLARQQQVLRFDRENDSPFGDAAIAAILERAAGHIAGCGAVIVSDYGKGLVSQALMAGLKPLAGRLPLLVDPKPKNTDLYKGVTLLTPNARETSESTGMPVKARDEVVAAGLALMRKLACEHLVTTLGSRGMAVFEHGGAIWHIPTTAQQVFDVTGAGDTVIAVIAAGLAAGLPLLPSCLLANYAAGVVVSQVGAAVCSPGQLAAAISGHAASDIQRWD